MDSTPNTRTVREYTDEKGNKVQQVDYESNVGGSLKVRYLIERDDEKGWLSFDPANLQVWFNGAKIEFLQSLKIVIDSNSIPRAELSFKLDSLDIDMDSLMALRAIVKAQEEKSNAEKIREALEEDEEEDDEEEDDEEEEDE